VEEKEHAAESAEAKARADEAGALQLKADDKNKLQKLKSENKALRREVNTADTKQKLLALELQADTSKAVQAARKAVKRQAALDKEEKQSELHTLRSSAEKLKKKLHNERSKLRVEHSEVLNQESENRKLQKKVASDMTFTQQEVRNAVTKAHLVSEKLWQPKVVMLTHQMEEVQDRAQAKVEATEKAVKEWAHTALSLKDKLEEQASAEKILGRAHRDVKAAHLHMAQMKTAVARANEDAVAAKSMLQSTDQKLSNAIAEKQLYHNQVKKLQDQEGVMLKKQTVLTLQSKRMKRKLKEMQDKLNEARAKLRPQQQENSSDTRKVKFATNKDFVEITSNQPGGGAEHLLPHKLNLDIQDPKNHDA
jgi:hypothetical protein